MRDNWTKCLAAVLRHEGGNDDDPRDPGGRTSRGIIQSEWTRYVASHPERSLPKDVWKAPQDAVEDIYKQKYWNVQRCDDLPSGVDYAMFDYGVNSGVGRSGKVLRKLLGMDATTSVISPAVVEAARKRDARELVNSICDERAVFLRRLKTWPVFGKGWERRVKEVRAAALAMAAKGKPVSRDDTEISAQSKPAIKSSEIWASVGTIATTILGVVTDWRVLTVLVVGFALFIIWRRYSKDDISGWFK